MRALLPTDQDWPLYSAAASRQIEALALSQRAPHALIERAGAAVARLAMALCPQRKAVLILAGAGNNGGDGVIAARWLHQRGWPVHLHVVAGDPAAGSDAAHAWSTAADAGLALQRGLPDPSTRFALVIDALLGLGAARPPEGDIAAAIDLCEGYQRKGALVLSVDLPSGLAADTGQPFGKSVIRADHTLALLTLKPGLVTGEGRALCGRLWFDDLGVEPLNDTPELEPLNDTPGLEPLTDAPKLKPLTDAPKLEPLNDAPGVSTASKPYPAPSAWLTGRSRLHDHQAAHARSPTSHKGRHGDVVVLGGAPGMRGAAWLAASAALSAGAGRVYAALPEGDGQPWPARPELMLWNFARWDGDGAAKAQTVAVCGCGGGQAILPWLKALLEHAPRLVLDADALNLMASDPALQRLLTERAGRDLATVLTPHPLEAARLLSAGSGSRGNNGSGWTRIAGGRSNGNTGPGSSGSTGPGSSGSTDPGSSGKADVSVIQRDRLNAAQTLADRYRCTIVLKGAGTVIAAPGETPVINSTGSAALATAGSGDVLAGWLGGLWAQAQAVPAFDLTCAGVAWHGAAAEDHAGPLLAADLITAMAALHEVVR